MSSFRNKFECVARDSLRLFLMAGMLAAGSAWASCEVIVSVQSRELDFQSYDRTSDDSLSVAEWGATYRGVARSIAVASRCFEYARMHSCEAGTPPRTGILLYSALEAADTSDVNAFYLVRDCAVLPADSVATLWTCEIGRFRTKERAEAFGIEPRITSPKDLFAWRRRDNATLCVVTCGGTLEAGSFIVRLDRATVAPWSRRLGIFFTREDAERAGRAYSREWGRVPRIVRQRVGPGVLEQALTQEC